MQRQTKRSDFATWDVGYCEMIKYIVCLGNSYKNSGRCIAGVEVMPNNDGIYTLVKQNSNPIWIRPVMFNPEESIPDYIAEDFKPLDILKIDCGGNIVDGSHTEDTYFQTIIKVGSVAKNSEMLNLFCDRTHEMLFGNSGNSLTKNEFSDGNYSVMLIKPESPRFQTTTDFISGKKRSRVHFSYQGIPYNLPITDPVYLNKLRQSGETTIVRKTGDIYMVVSLGVEYQSLHYKLAASIFDLTA